MSSFGSRFNIHKSDNFPGPGSYRVYSEFGDLPKVKRRKFKFKKRKDSNDSFYMEEEEKDKPKPGREEIKNGSKVAVSVKGNNKLASSCVSLL